VKTLLVGGRGFIGSHLSKIVDCDILEGDFLAWDFTRYRTIVFLAHRFDFNFEPEGYRYHQKLYKRLDEYLTKYPKTHIIFLSSCYVYGEALNAKESQILKPMNLYGQAKMLGEKIVAKYPHHTILRISNVYGDGGHSAIDAFLRGGTTIYGDGTQIRDFVPVEYVVACIKDCIHDRIYGTYNISSGYGQDINSVFKQFGVGEPNYVEDTYLNGNVQNITLSHKKWLKARGQA
jgi:nucleoside-diphosphate-sugar epimerase